MLGSQKQTQMNGQHLSTSAASKIIGERKKKKALPMLSFYSVESFLTFGIKNKTQQRNKYSTGELKYSQDEGTGMILSHQWEKYAAVPGCFLPKSL